MDHPEYPGVSFEVIAGPGIVEEGGPPPPVEGPVMQMFRTVLEPLGEIFEHEHQGHSLWRIESGSIEFTAVAGDIWAKHAGSAAPELLQPGTTIRLQPGDWVQQFDTATHAARNPSEEESAVILVVGHAEPTQMVLFACWGAC